MISIVVCSIDEKMFNEFSQSVAATIGVPFEIIRIDNRKNEYNICAAYNKGKEMCKYDIVCFSHEDILFETNNWGMTLISTLKNPAIGLVGVLGICYLSLFPNDWIALSECEGQITVGAKKDRPTERYRRFPGSSTPEVAAVDGVFLCTRKSIIDKLRFSDDILKGFHGYDIDISWQIRKKYKIVVTRDILFFHYSGGAFNAAYHEAMKQLSKKWHTDLPAYVSNYSKKELQALKIRSLDIYCQKSSGKRMLIKNNLTAIGYASKHGVLSIWLKKKMKNTLRRFSRRTVRRSGEL